ncbi:hypothetical protein A6767_21105 [Aeromonas veronii]|nr:hypothetical protein A6767_21105 [Aeromonas veronii]
MIHSLQMVTMHDERDAKPGLTERNKALSPQVTDKKRTEAVTSLRVSLARPSCLRLKGILAGIPTTGIGRDHFKQNGSWIPLFLAINRR